MLVTIMRDPTTRRSERIAACAILFDRAAGKPHASSSVNVSAAMVSLPVGWAQMGNADRTAWADHLRQRALSGAVGLLDVGDDE